EKLTSREDLIGLLFFYVQSDEDTFLKVDEVSKTEAQMFNIVDKCIDFQQFSRIFFFFFAIIKKKLKGGLYDETTKT
ncbi:MAG: hypothetical protein E6523_04775, partial [Streptococcus sp.]|nr:hypothetical protein [Streptococcus sp.]